MKRQLTTKQVRRFERDMERQRQLVKEPGSVLVERLNEMAGKPAGRRLARLVENIQRLSKIESKHWRIFPEKGMREEILRLRENPSSAGQRKELARLKREIHRELKRCKTHPVMFAPFLPFDWAKPAGGEYTSLILKITNLANEGLLGRLRRCRTCSKWVFAKKRDQNFCRAACRQKHYQSDPGVKQRRRERMRKYMRGYRAMKIPLSR